MDRLTQIRRAERESHLETYTANALFESGSWLAKPVKTVLDLLPLFAGCGTFRALDLGCGVGRNSIPVARAFSHIPCRVDCVDILPYAIERLRENAERFGVTDAIRGIVSGIDEFEIPADSYDLILAVSALEHMDSLASFTAKLAQIRRGLRGSGIACLILNTGVRERDKATGRPLPPQFEVNLETEQLERLISAAFPGWNVVKHTVAHQKYDIPRDRGPAELETEVVTWVLGRC